MSLKTRNNLQLTVRSMTDADLVDVLRLEKEIFSDPWPRDMFTEHATGGHWTALSAESAGKLVGYACYRIEEDKAHLTNMAVDPEYQRKSVAKRLLENILRIVQESGCELITLEVRASNSGAIAFYTAFGFVELYRQPNYYRRPVEEACVMVRYINDEDEN